jgi:hypothetical protein
MNVEVMNSECQPNSISADVVWVCSGARVVMFMSSGSWLVTTGSTEAHLPAERCILRSAVMRPDDSTALAAVCTLDAENAREQEVGTPFITFFICPCTYTIMQKGSLVHARMAELIENLPCLLLKYQIAKIVFIVAHEGLAKRVWCESHVTRLLSKHQIAMRRCSASCQMLHLRIESACRR